MGAQAIDYGGNHQGDAGFKEEIVTLINLLWGSETHVSIKKYNKKPFCPGSPRFGPIYFPSDHGSRKHL
jgi:hypothetical protein